MGITSMWLPPPTKGASTEGTGMSRIYTFCDLPIFPRADMLATDVYNTIGLPGMQGMIRMTSMTLENLSRKGTPGPAGAARKN